MMVMRESQRPETAAGSAMLRVVAASQAGLVADWMASETEQRWEKCLLGADILLGT